MIDKEEIAAVRADSHTIDSLIAKLTEMKADGVPGYTIVVMSKYRTSQDISCSPIPLYDGVDHGMYLPNRPWSGDHFMTEEHRHSLDDGDEYDPAPSGAIPAVFIWPTD